MLLAGLLLTCMTSAASARTFWVEELFAGAWLNESPWALSNQVQAIDCRGVGKARRDAAYQDTYTSFRCDVRADSDNTRLGEVLVVPAGPEFLRVVRPLSGNPPPYKPIGPIPRGSGPTMRSSDVPPLLDRTRWARRDRYDAARCFGIGRFAEVKGIGSAGFYFTAFVCRTAKYGGQAHVLLVTSARGQAVRVVRVLV